MKATVVSVNETFIDVRLTVEEARAVVDALSYFNSAVGGNNFEMGYRDEDPSVMVGHKMARRITTLLDRQIAQAERKEEQ